MRRRSRLPVPRSCAPGSDGLPGDFTRSQRDSADLDCDTCREALSAELDGEALPVPSAHVREHLEQCSACRSWEHRASDLSRTLRVHPVHPVPDVSRSVAARYRSGKPFRWPRVLLGCVALCQIALGATQIPGLPGSSQEHADRVLTAGHLFNESTAWNIALGLGMLWCAYRVRASAGLIPVLSAFLTVLTGFCVVDAISATVPASRLAAHGLLVVGFVCLLLVHRGATGWRPRPTAEHARPSDTSRGPGEEVRHDPVTTREASDHGPLPPTGLRRAG